MKNQSSRRAALKQSLVLALALSVTRCVSDNGGIDSESALRTTQGRGRHGTPRFGGMCTWPLR
jgi:hypothetical protein